MLNIEDVNTPFPTDEEYGEWRETMHVDPYEVLDEFPGEVEDD